MRARARAAGRCGTSSAAALGKSRGGVVRLRIQRACNEFALLTGAFSLGFWGGRSERWSWALKEFNERGSLSIDDVLLLKVGRVQLGNERNL